MTTLELILSLDEKQIAIFDYVNKRMIERELSKSELQELIFDIKSFTESDNSLPS